MIFYGTQRTTVGFEQGMDLVNVVLWEFGMDREETPEGERWIWRSPLIV